MLDKVIWYYSSPISLSIFHGRCCSFFFLYLLINNEHRRLRSIPPCWYTIQSLRSQETFQKEADRSWQRCPWWQRYPAVRFSILYTAHGSDKDMSSLKYTHSVKKVKNKINERSRSGVSSKTMCPNYTGGQALFQPLRSSSHAVQNPILFVT